MTLTRFKREKLQRLYEEKYRAVQERINETIRQRVRDNAIANSKSRFLAGIEQ